MDPEIMNCLTSFGAILGAILGPNLFQEANKNGTSFGPSRPRLSGVGELRFCELNRSGGIAMATGITFDKRKGGIYIYIYIERERENYTYIYIYQNIPFGYTDFRWLLWWFLKRAFQKHREG